MRQEKEERISLVEESGSDNTFEEQLTRSLKKAEKENHSHRWEWINKPLGIWVITTLSFSVVGYLYTNYSLCRAAQVADNEAITRIVYELEERADAMNHAWRTTFDVSDENLRNLLRPTLNPKETYFLLDFKDQSISGLSFQVERLLNKWSLWRPDALGNKIYTQNEAENPPAEDPSGSRLLNYLRNTTLDVYRWGTMFVNRVGEQDAVRRAVHNSMNDGQDAVYFAQKRALSNFISPTVCVRRTIWPF